MKVVVEVICRSEDKLVGRIEAPVENAGTARAKANLDGSVVRTMTVLDRIRAPKVTEIETGTQMKCQRCHGALWFRAANGELFAGNPGTVVAVP